jgi:hypothetical protein
MNKFIDKFFQFLSLSSILTFFWNFQQFASNPKFSLPALPPYPFWTHHAFPTSF